MLSAKVLIAPLRFGAGIKGKLIDAMRFATPSITTWIGAEGITSTDSITANSNVQEIDEPKQLAQWPGALCSANTTDAAVIQDYVEQAVALHNEKSTWDSASNLTASVLSSFESQQPEVPLIEKVIGLKQSLNTHRNGLFMQSLLWHQTLTASKYMSQWIEAKNK